MRQDAAVFSFDRSAEKGRKDLPCRIDPGLVLPVFPANGTPGSDENIAVASGTDGKLSRVGQNRLGCLTD